MAMLDNQMVIGNNMYPLVISYMTIENGPVEIADLPWFTHSKWWFSIIMLLYQRVMQQVALYEKSYLFGGCWSTQRIPVGKIHEEHDLFLGTR